ncbi:MAG: hypothetical protein LW878_03060 [Proteobacteria bacterium]|jgi:hypothetical protein|nr:hypothetical protein [Pseudomonadota bacterium]
MRFKSAFLATSFILSASLTAIADVNIKIVDNYALAQEQEVWKRVRSDDVPESLQKSLRINRPTTAFESLFPKSFYQEEDFIVCFKDCSQSDARSGKDALEQQTVYYWLGQFYKMTKERFNLLPSQRVKVTTNRTVRDPGTSKKMRNNAFFNPADGSLSFLPASANPLAALLGGKINRSGFDPSVIAHEAGHSLFNALFPHAINPEINGFNEGFADYMANILMENAKVGLVMLRGKALRDSDSLVDSSNKPKVYEPGLDVHDMGERFAAALWMGRSRVSDKEEYDHMIISAIQDIAKNPFATGHSFKEAFLARINYTYPTATAYSIATLWELFVPGSDRKVTDLSFIGTPNTTRNAIGLRVTTTFPESVMRDLGISNETARFVFIRSVKTTENFVAYQVASRTDNLVTPYWILVDPERKNALGAWRLDGTEIDASETKTVGTLVAQILNIGELVQNFVQRAKMFSDLAQGRGELTAAYKVTRHNRNQSSVEFDGAMVTTIVHELTLKRKLLARFLGVPNMQGISLTTSSGLDLGAQWPVLEGQPVIGVKLILEDGTTSETLMETIQL